MQTAKTEEELNKIKGEFIGYVQRTTSGSFFSTSFKNKNLQLKQDIESLATHLMMPMQETREAQHQERVCKTNELLSDYTMRQHGF